MKINKKLIIVSIFLIPILAVGATLVYSANLNDTKSSLLQEVMNPYDFFKECRASGGLGFSWDNGYGCDFLDEYDIVCDNNGVCGEGFVAEIDPQILVSDSQSTEFVSENNEVTGTIFDVGLHADYSREQFSSVIQDNLQTGDADRKKEKTSDVAQEPDGDDSHQSLKDYCTANGGTYSEENDGKSCDLPGDEDDISCSNSVPCDFPKPEPELEIAGASIPTNFGVLTSVDANNKYLFVNKPDSTPVSFLIKSDDNQINPLAGSNQLYSSLEGQGKGGDSTNIGIFRLNSKWGVHEYEGLIFPISKLAYLLPESPDEPPKSEVVEQVEKDEQVEKAVDPQPTEQTLLTVSSKQNMNCRCGAGTNTKTYTTFRVNTVANVLGRNVDGDWYFVEFDGGNRCWVWGDGLQDDSHLDNVPIPDSTLTEFGNVCSSDDDSKERASNDDANPNTGGDTNDPQPPPNDEPPPPPSVYEPPACAGCGDIVDPGNTVVTDPGGDTGGGGCGGGDDVCVDPVDPSEPPPCIGCDGGVIGP